MEQPSTAVPAGTPAPAANPANQTEGTRIPEQTPATAPLTPTPAPTPESTQETTPEATPTQDVQNGEKKTETTPAFSQTNMEQVRDLVTEAGLNVDDVVGVLKENEGKLSPEIVLALKEKYGDAVTNLISDQLGNMWTGQVDAAKAKDKAVHDQVAEAFKDMTTQTGEETWKELAGWAKENVPNEDRKEINALLAQGGMAAKLAVQELCSVFKESTGTQQTQEAQLMEADGVSNGDDRGAIDKVGYTQELNKLLDAGHSYETSPQIKALQSRRTKSMNRGY